MKPPTKAQRQAWAKQLSKPLSLEEVNILKCRMLELDCRSNDLSETEEREYAWLALQFWRPTR